MPLFQTADELLASNVKWDMNVTQTYLLRHSKLSMCALSQTWWPECDLQVFHWIDLFHSCKQTSYWESYTVFISCVLETLQASKTTIFRDMTLCSLVEVYRRFGGTYCLHLRIKKQAKEAPSVIRWLIVWLTLLNWWWEQYIPPKRRRVCTELHGVTSQKIVVFMGAAVRIWSPTQFGPCSRCDRLYKTSQSQPIEAIVMQRI
jgi:hypothetical protein